MNKSQIILQQSAYIFAIVALAPSLLRGSKPAIYSAFLIEIGFVETLIDQYVLHPSRFIDVGYFPLLKLYIGFLLGAFVFSDAVSFFKERRRHI
jgi:hypothetical protein